MTTAVQFAVVKLRGLRWYLVPPHWEPQSDTILEGPWALGIRCWPILIASAVLTVSAVFIARAQSLGHGVCL